MAKVSQEELNEALGFAPEVIDAPAKGEEGKKEEPKKGEEEEEEGAEGEEKKKEDEVKTEVPKKDEGEEKPKEEPAKGEEEGKKAEGAEGEEKKKEEPKKGEEEVEIKAEQVDAFLSKELEEYDIANLDDLRDVLDGVDKLTEALEAERAKSKTPEFKSEAQKKAFEFITASGYDPEKFGEALMTHAKLVTMDVDKADDRTALEEQYVMEHPELTRAEAEFKFNKRYKSKYEVDKAKFEDADEFADEQKSAAIELKSDSVKARKFLKEKQATYKAEDKGEKSKDVTEQVPAPIQNGIKKTVAEFNKYVDGLTELIWTDDKDPDNQFTYKIPQKYLKQIQTAGNRYLSRPDIYNEEGIVPQYDPEQYAIKVTSSLLTNEIIQAALRHSSRKAEIIKADKIAEVKPDRKGGKVDGAVESQDFMVQAEALANKKERERNQRKR